MRLSLLALVLLAPLAASAQPATAPGSFGGLAVVSLHGDGTALDGTFPTVRCGDYFYPGARVGVVYEVHFDDWRLTVLDDDNRRPGTYPFARPAGYGELPVSIFLNGPRPYAIPGSPGTITFSDDFGRAEVDVQLSTVDGQDRVALRASFVCEGVHPPEEAACPTEGRIRSQIRHLAESVFPDDVGLAWTVHDVRRHVNGCEVEVEPEPATVGYDRIRLVVAGADELRVTSGRVLTGDGRWVLLFD